MYFIVYFVILFHRIKYYLYVHVV